MAETAEPPRRRRLWPLAAGLVAGVASAAGGFLLARSGALAPPQAAVQGESPGAVAFVPVPPIVVSPGGPLTDRHLRFAAQLEVAPAQADAVAHLMPRILDVMNGYLRAVDASDLDGPGALVRLRAQLLRRVQIVTGEGLVTDLLVTEFVLN